jgi:hypothetical protein
MGERSGTAKDEPYRIDEQSHSGNAVIRSRLHDSAHYWKRGGEKEWERMQRNNEADTAAVEINRLEDHVCSDIGWRGIFGIAGKDHKWTRTMNTKGRTA